MQTLLRKKSRREKIVIDTLISGSNWFCTVQMVWTLQVNFVRQANCFSLPAPRPPPPPPAKKATNNCQNPVHMKLYGCFPTVTPSPLPGGLGAQKTRKRQRSANTLALQNETSATYLPRQCIGIPSAQKMNL